MGTVRLLAALLAAAATGCGNPAPVDASPPQGFADDRSVIQVVSTNVQGKNVYIPGTIVVTAGKAQTLSIHNTTDTPHGMSIPALGIAEILQPGEEHVLTLPKLEGGHVFDVQCHLHPPHRGATLVVLHATE